MKERKEMAEEDRRRLIETYRQTKRKRRKEGISIYEKVKMQKLRSCDVQMKSNFEKTEK
jgi:hypothetical protein